MNDRQEQFFFPSFLTHRPVGGRVDLSSARGIAFLFSCVGRQAVWIQLEIFITIRHSYIHTYSSSNYHFFIGNRRKEKVWNFNTVVCSSYKIIKVKVYYFGSLTFFLQKKKGTSHLLTYTHRRLNYRHHTQFYNSWYYNYCTRVWS